MIIWVSAARSLGAGVMLAMVLLLISARPADAKTQSPFISLAQTPTEAATVTHTITSTIGVGWFYTQTSGSDDQGYTVTDAGGVRFWSEFERLGGVDILGFPSSWRYVGQDGFIYQAFQGSVLQWRPESDRVAFANIFEILHDAGHDDWLDHVKAIPHPIANDGSGGDYQKAVKARLGWLTNVDIRNFYFANPNPDLFREWEPEDAIELHGLPMSKPERRGPFIIQRFQRTALQQWVEPVAGMPILGSVVRVLAGDIFKELGQLPEASTKPTTIYDPLVKVDSGLREALTLLLDDASAEHYVHPLLDELVPAIFRPVQVGVVGFFVPSDPVIYVSPRFAMSDPRALATVVLHELVHLNDLHVGRDLDSKQDCLASELRAFIIQTEYWERVTGPAGKIPPSDDLERQLNSILAGLTVNPEQFTDILYSIYDEQCEVKNW